MDDPVRPEPPGMGLLFWQCLVIGVTSFGGGLNAYVRMVFVRRRQWVTETEFIEALEVAQALPGPNVVNLVTMLGRLLRGPAGAACAFIGLVAPAIVANAVLVALVLPYADGRWFAAGLAGLAAAAAGLSIANAGQLALRHLRRWPDIVLALLAVGVILVVRPPLIVSIAVFGATGVLIHYLGSRPRADVAADE